MNKPTEEAIEKYPEVQRQLELMEDRFKEYQAYLSGEIEETSPVCGICGKPNSPVPYIDCDHCRLCILTDTKNNIDCASYQHEDDGFGIDVRQHCDGYRTHTGITHEDIKTWIKELKRRIKENTGVEL